MPDELREIKEAELNPIDRLGLAYCRLNKYEWDIILGEKPADFDDLPRTKQKRKPWQRRQSCKLDYITPAMRAITSIIGAANCSRCWWIFELGKSEEEWFQWYVKDRFRNLI